MPQTDSQEYSIRAVPEVKPSQAKEQQEMALKQARRLYERRAYPQALAACRQVAPADRSADLQALQDEICMHSAATGSLIGFDGRVLQVQPADPATAWMGQQQQQPAQGSSTYSSIAEALAAAADGDTIQLLPGTHIISQVCLALDKRVLLEGLGASPQQVLLDHRANHPAFNVTRCCILRNFAVDMVGFCEAVAISSVACIKPILQQLHISCSGDDCVLVGGSAQPLLQRCTIQARRCGVKQHAASSTTLWSCTISGGTHGLVVCGHSQAFLEGCTVQDCSQDGIVVLQQAGVHLSHSSVSGCRGPAVDVCDDGTASLKHVDISECCGGVWLWQRANCEAVSSYISGGSSYAVLLDQQAYARGSSCSIDGPCHDSSEAPPPLLAHGTTALHPHGSAGESSSSSSTTRHGPGNYAGADASAAAASADADDIPLRQKHGAGSAQQFQTVAAQPPQQQHDTEMWQDPSAAGSTLKPCSHLQCSSPFSTGACSDNSSPDMLVYMAGSSKAEYRGCLVGSEMLVQDAAAAAALFPAEQGAFAVEQRLY